MRMLTDALLLLAGGTSALSVFLTVCYEKNPEGGSR